MRRGSTMDLFATSLLASLGLLEVTACGGKSTDARRVSDAGIDDAATSSGGRAGKGGEVDAPDGTVHPTGGSSGAAPSVGGRSGAPGAGGEAGVAGDGGIESGT